MTAATTVPVEQLDAMYEHTVPCDTHLVDRTEGEAAHHGPARWYFEMVPCASTHHEREGGPICDDCLEAVKAAIADFGADGDYTGMCGRCGHVMDVRDGATWRPL